MTLQDKMRAPGGFTTGFDYIRIILSFGVLISHSAYLTSGIDYAFVVRYSLLPTTLLPAFFALSGFLVTGSLQRVRLHQFVVLRLLRIIPALAVEITLSALLIGPLVSALPLSSYVTDSLFPAYFLNIIGYIHFFLPGVFHGNPLPGVMNGQLWTVPFEFECYISLIVLAVLRSVSRRGMLSVAVVLACLAYTAKILLTQAIIAPGHVAGRMLVLSFLAAVAINLYKDVIPFSNRLGVVSVILSLLLLQFRQLSYMAPFPVAYATIWLGLLRPPGIPFGDLSYGVFLFHWPVEQTVVHVMPFAPSWWLLSLMAVPLTAACAWLSWTLVESPLLSRKTAALALSDRSVAMAGDVIGRLRRRPGASAGATGMMQDTTGRKG